MQERSQECLSGDEFRTEEHKARHVPGKDISYSSTIQGSELAVASQERDLHVSVSKGIGELCSVCNCSHKS